MPVISTCKFKIDVINSGGDKVASSIFEHSRAANILISRGLWLKFEVNYKSMGIFSDAQGHLTHCYVDEEKEKCLYCFCSRERVTSLPHLIFLRKVT